MVAQVITEYSTDKPVARRCRFNVFWLTSPKVAYRDVLSRLRDLIHDLERDSAQEQLAS